MKVIGNVLPAIAAVALPDNLAVPPAAAAKVMPVGNVPVIVIVATGEPVVVMMNVNADPVSAVAVAALVKAGAWATVMVICSLWVEDPLTDVTVTGYDPTVPTAGTPVITAAPGVAVNVTPAGSVPVSERVGVGVPVAEMSIVPV